MTKNVWRSGPRWTVCWPGSPCARPGRSPSSGSSSGQLPNTGVDVLGYLLSELSLLILGFGLVLVARRRRLGAR